jgi:hypothetical protein
MRDFLKLATLSLAGLVLFSGVGSCAWFLFWAPDLMVFGNDLEPRQQYEVMTGLEPTQDVQDIEGIGGGWQGYDFWLRFRCNQQTVDRLLTQGYTRCEPAELEDKLDFDAHRRSFNPDHFTPEWNPGDLAHQRCYKIENTKNGWTESAWNWLAYDPSTGWVHLYSAGT